MDFGTNCRKQEQRPLPLTQREGRAALQGGRLFRRSKERAPKYAVWTESDLQAQADAYAAEQAQLQGQEEAFLEAQREHAERLRLGVGLHHAANAASPRPPGLDDVISVGTPRVIPPVAMGTPPAGLHDARLRFAGSALSGRPDTGEQQSAGAPGSCPPDYHWGYGSAARRHDNPASQLVGAPGSCPPDYGAVQVARSQKQPASLSSRLFGFRRNRAREEAVAAHQVVISSQAAREADGEWDADEETTYADAWEEPGSRKKRKKKKRSRKPKNPEEAANDANGEAGCSAGGSGPPSTSTTGMIAQAKIGMVAAVALVVVVGGYFAYQKVLTFFGSGTPAAAAAPSMESGDLDGRGGNRLAPGF